jgi:hypothetical protein
MAARTHAVPSSLAFIRHLVEDVIAARQRLKYSETQTARRDVIRASIAAVEGAVWVGREHVRSALADLEKLAPVADLALRERTYFVSRDGVVKEQERSFPLLTAVRLIVDQAEIICPGLAVDFSAAGWSHLRQAIKIRNRITHPKPRVDLSITDQDLSIAASALSWLLRTVDYVMTRVNAALAEHVDEVREVVELLKAGDPAVLAEYEAALRGTEVED